jgi:hypothetical protein
MLTYLLFILPGLLLALWASLLTKSTFEKHSHVAASSGLTGAQAARRLLENAGIGNVAVEPTTGFLSDHYDPSARKLRLSEAVFNGKSLSAIGVACHEAGHAIQHAEVYGPLGLRTVLVPVASIAPTASYILIFLGFAMQSGGLIMFGIILFSAAVLFAIVTLPVEYNASARAKLLMQQAGIVNSREAKGAGEVLNAAFLTYVAAAVNSLLILLYYLYRAGLFGGRRN